MKIGVLGTGDVGRRIGGKLVALGHQVMLGSRSADHEGGRAWVAEAGEGASLGTFAQAAAHGDVVFLCVGGANALAVVESTGDALDGKVVVDVSNPLDFSKGFPPSLTVCNSDSIGEQVQKARPKARVVKALNTMANPIMVDPRQIDDTHHTFVSGDDADAKGEVKALLKSFGWRDDEIVDLGDITTARGTEMFLPLWVRLYGALGTPMFNVKLTFAPKE